MSTRVTLKLSLLVFMTACSIEDRTPAGARPDDAEIRNTVSQYYAAITTGTPDNARRGLWDSVVVVRAERGVWYSVVGADAWTDSLTVRAAFLSDPTESQPVRIDIRQQGDLAGVWVTVRGASGARVEHLLLTRDAARWRIVMVASAPVRPSP